MSLRFSSEVLDSAILSYQLRIEEPLDEVVLTCLCELKELRGRLTCNDFNNGYNQALDDVLKLISMLGIDWAVKNNDIDWLEKSVERLRK